MDNEWAGGLTGPHGDAGWLGVFAARDRDPQHALLVDRFGSSGIGREGQPELLPPAAAATLFQEVVAAFRRFQENTTKVWEAY